MNVKKIGFRGGCHWCTEGVFSIVKGVININQGWIASDIPYESFSEAIIVEYESIEVDLDNLIKIHLHTHACIFDHSMRGKYRSAVYAFNQLDKDESRKVIMRYCADFDSPIVTKTLMFRAFKSSEERYQDYYQKNPEKPFCQTYISPKVNMLMKEFSNLTQ
ncbi:peptide-methionine (S)-S-oxide reductase [Ekhidna sp.]